MTKTKQTAKRPAKLHTAIKKVTKTRTNKLFFGMFVTIALILCTVVVFATTYAATNFTTGSVPITASSDASASNIVVDATGNSIRLQYDYALANGATIATVDGAVNDSRSFGPVSITGSGHYDQTLTDLPNGTYTISIIISGNPDYELVTPGTNSQPLIITLPDTNTHSRNWHDIFHIDRFFCKPQNHFLWWSW